MAKYSLVGVDGNAYALMAYTSQALKHEGLYDLVDPMYKEATSGDYSNLICVCYKYLESANLHAAMNGSDVPEEDESEDY